MPDWFNPHMSMRVLIVPDKFKGTLTAAEAAKAIARGWRPVRSEDSLDCQPISDGGDGFGGVLGRLLRARPQTVRTVDAAHRPCRSTWWWEPETRTAIIESARVIGLAQLPPGRYHPFDLDTFGLGTVFAAAAKREARHCIVGIGGSATNDGGFGLARALGWKFLDRSGTPIENWTKLIALTEISPPAKRRLFPKLIVAVDVQNPLLGIRGATRVFGPQKGLRPRDQLLAERCLRRLATISRRRSKKEMANAPGAGAAGGLGFGLMMFLGARPQPGFDVIARHANLRRRIQNADVVVTGEGCLDESTVMGKGVGEIAKECLRHKVPCLGLAGRVEETKRFTKCFAYVRGLTALTSGSNATSDPGPWLSRLSAQAAKWVSGRNLSRTCQGRRVFWL